MHDTFRNVIGRVNGYEGPINGLNEEVKRFFKLVEGGKQEFYPGCECFSTLAAIIRLCLFKCLNDLSNVVFNDILDLLKVAFPLRSFLRIFKKVKVL